MCFLDLNIIMMLPLGMIPLNVSSFSAITAQSLAFFSFFSFFIDLSEPSLYDRLGTTDGSATDCSVIDRRVTGDIGTQADADLAEFHVC